MRETVAQRVPRRYGSIILKLINVYIQGGRVTVKLLSHRTKWSYLILIWNRRELIRLELRPVRKAA